MAIFSLPHLLFFSTVLAITSVSVQGQCLKDQKALLLGLKSEWKFDSSYSKVLVHWNPNQSGDCCSWVGVECDGSGHVITLKLEDESISGEVNNSSSLFGLRYLEVLSLTHNSLSGNIPYSFFQLQSLRHLSLSKNLFNGTFQLENIQSLSNLTVLKLSRNKLSVEVTNTNSSLHRFPKLRVLSLASCNLSVFPDFIIQSPFLRDLDLSDNRIAGVIPSWIWEIGLIKLNLSCNLLVELQKPYRFHTYLYTLDLHSNQLKGELPPFPKEALYVDYSNNNFDTTIPTRDVSSHMFFLSLANNSLSGEFPTSLCNAKKLEVLDLSFNDLRGNIPLCPLRNMMENLEVLNMRGNNINGTIPDQLPLNLRTLDLSNNNLSGKIPKTIANYKHLAVFNVGYNNFDDTFPCMLPSSLRVLVLRFNRFHGELRCDKSWPHLQIVDISFNNFSGSLHPLNFSSWRGMILESGAHLRPNHLGNNFLRPNYFYLDEVTLTMKGLELKLVKIWPDFTSIDLSCNNFEGDIPDAIGNLSSLYLLNLSHNALTGTIPRSLGALTELESLDISANQLRGRIPEDLARLIFLSFLNLSNNDLTGMIPTGPQFQTLSANSFEGNTGLCGFPLNTSCSDTTHGSGVTPSKSKDEEIEWEYVFAALGYVVGLGSTAWTLLCRRSFRHRYFEKIDEVVDKLFY